MYDIARLEASLIHDVGDVGALIRGPCETLQGLADVEVSSSGTMSSVLRSTVLLTAPREGSRRVQGVPRCRQGDVGGLAPQARTMDGSQVVVKTERDAAAAARGTVVATGESNVDNDAAEGGRQQRCGGWRQLLLRQQRKISSTYSCSAGSE
jgi:hypothetical protein